MKAGEECYPCLKKLALQASSLSSDDHNLRNSIEKHSIKLLDGNFSFDIVPVEIANEMHRITRRLSGNPDPYKEFKNREIEFARKIFGMAKFRAGSTLRSCIELAVLGNTIDFFRDSKEVERDILSGVSFAIDDIAVVEEKLQEADKVLYLADNAGEVFFDIPLIKKLEEYAEVVYAVKQSAVQNDLTIDDLRGIAFTEKIGRVITTGTDTVGIDFSAASSEFLYEFYSADLIFAKGMGYYETLSELPGEGRILFILMAKCPPVARSLGVPLKSYAAKLW